MSQEHTEQYKIIGQAIKKYRGIVVIEIMLYRLLRSVGNQ